MSATTATTYADWAQHHGSLFGLASDQDAQMLLLWADLFAQIGYTPGQLLAASQRIAASDPPRFRSDHLRLLKDHLAALTLTSQREQRAAAAAHDCLLCGGSGRVVVPYPEPIQRLGGWYTCAVLCRCPLGLWLAQNQQGELRMQGLLDYERENPRWREQMAAHDRALATAHQAGAMATELDRVMGEIRGRFRARLAARQGAEGGER